MRRNGVVSGIGCPIIVGRRLSGVVVGYKTTPEPFPPGAEVRMNAFAELAATAIANAQSCADLQASRARIVSAADQARRHIERDLHDGTQQRLIALSLRVRDLQANVPEEKDRIDHELECIAHIADEAVTEPREIAHGLHPAILAKGGLKRALVVLARRSAVPVELAIDLDRRLPESVEVSVYYIVSEALTNIAKHALASAAAINLAATGESVRLCVRDDGIGGADIARGSGLTGLIDRVESLGGCLHITGPPGRGTTMTVELPAEINDTPTIVTSATAPPRPHQPRER